MERVAPKGPVKAQLKEKKKGDGQQLVRKKEVKKEESDQMMEIAQEDFDGVFTKPRKTTKRVRIDK